MRIHNIYADENVKHTSAILKSNCPKQVPTGQRQRNFRRQGSYFAPPRRIGFSIGTLLLGGNM
jgi:hypothetical protein